MKVVCIIDESSQFFFLLVPLILTKSPSSPRSAAQSCGTDLELHMPIQAQGAITNRDILPTLDLTLRTHRTDALIMNLR